MNFTISKTDDTLIYQAIDIDGLTEKQLGDMFFTKVDNHYEKKFSVDSLMFEHDTEKMEIRYNRFIRDEVTKNRTFQDLEETLFWLISEHDRLGIRWWLTGSTALYVRGIKLFPHDIDVMTYKTEIHKIQDLVYPYIVEPFHHLNNWVVKGFGVADKNFRIDYAFEPEDWVDQHGNMDFGPYAEKHLEEVIWQGKKIWVPDIQLQVLSNKIRNRLDRTKLIQEYIDRREST